MNASTGRFNIALDVLGIEGESRERVKRRWKAEGRPAFHRFAPYAAYVLTVELFFHFAVSSDLIASTRPSHRIDIGYLHYLPFCQVFVSTDKLHRLCAPLFLRNDQSFAWGLDLKPDLAAINGNFSELSEAEKAEGIMRFAKRLPEIELPTIRELFKRHTPSLLKPYEVGPASKDAHDAVMAQVEAIESAPQVHYDVPMNALDQMVIKRMVSPRRGSWIVVPEELVSKK